jgi:hypothetical protein
MRKVICAVLLTTLPAIPHAQELKDDDQLKPLNQIRWNMSKEEVLQICNANKLRIGGSDTTVTFDAVFFGVDAKAFVRFKNKAEKPWGIDVKFKELSEKLLDTIVNHFTRITGKPPVRAEKEKSLLLVTMRMEIAAWKTNADKIMLMVGRQNKSIFDINLSFQPIVH